MQPSLKRPIAALLFVAGGLFALSAQAGAVQWNGCTHCQHEDEVVRAAALGDPAAAPLGDPAAAPLQRSDLSHKESVPAANAAHAGTPTLFGNVVLGIDDDMMLPDLVGARPTHDAYLFGVRIPF